MIILKTIMISDLSQNLLQLDAALKSRKVSDHPFFLELKFLGKR